MKKARLNAGNVQRKLKVVNSAGDRVAEKEKIQDDLCHIFNIERIHVIKYCLEVEETNDLLRVSEKEFYNERTFKDAVGRLIDSPLDFGEILLQIKGREHSFESQIVSLGHRIRKEIARWKLANSESYEDFLSKGFMSKVGRVFKNQLKKRKGEQTIDEEVKRNYVLTKSRLRDGHDKEMEAALEKEKAQAAYNQKVSDAILEAYDGKVVPIVYKTALLGAGSAIAYHIKSQRPDPEETLLNGTAQPWKNERGGDGNINHPPHQLMVQEGVEENAKYPDSQGSLTKRKDFTRYLEEVIAPFAPKEIMVTKIERKAAGDDSYYEIEAVGKKYFAQNVVYGIGAEKHRPPGFVDNPEGGKLGLNDAETFFTTDGGWAFKRVMEMDLFQNFLIENEAKEEGKINIAELEVIVIGPNAAIDVVTACVREGVKKVKWMAGGRTPLFLEGTDNLIAKEEYDKATGGGINIIEVVRERANVVGPKGAGDKPVVIGVNKGRYSADLVVYGIGQDGSPINRLLPEGVDFDLMYDRNLHFNEEPEDSLALKSIEPKSPEKSLSKLEAERLMRMLKQEELMEPLDKLPLDTLSGFDMEKAQLLPTVTGLTAAKASPHDSSSFQIVGATANSILRTRNISNQYFFIDDVVDGLAEGDLIPLVRDFKLEFGKIKIREGILVVNRRRLVFEEPEIEEKLRLKSELSWTASVTCSTRPWPQLLLK